MKIKNGGHELKVTSTYLDDGGDVVVVVRLPDEVMERLRQPDNLSARAANACMPQQDVDLHGLKQDCERIRDEVIGLRDQVSRSITDCKRFRDEAQEARDHAIKAWLDHEDLEKRVEKLADKAHDFERSARTNSIAAQQARDGALDAAKQARGDVVTSQRIRDEVQEHRIASEGAAEEDDLSAKYESLRGELTRMQENYNGASAEARTLRKDRDEWQRVAEQNQAQVRAKEDEVAGLIDSRDTWKRRAEEYRARLVKAGDKEALAQHYPGDFAAGASTQQEVKE